MSAEAWPRSSPEAAKRGVADAGLEVGHEPRDDQDRRLVLSGAREAGSFPMSAEEACPGATLMSAISPGRSLLAAGSPRDLQRDRAVPARRRALLLSVCLPYVDGSE